MEEKRKRRRIIYPYFIGGGMHPYDAKVLALNPTFYFPLTEGSGTVIRELVNGWNGAYSATGVTYGVAGPGDGRTAVTFDGSAGFGNLYTAGLSAGFMHAGVGTICLFFAAANWTATNGRVFSFTKTAGANAVYVTQNNTNDRLEYTYYAGSTAKVTSEASGQTSTVFRHVAITWDITAGANGELKAYINGAQVGTTQTALGTWSATDLASSLVNLGADASTPTALLAGSYARLAGYPVALTAAQLATLAAAA